MIYDPQILILAAQHLEIVQGLYLSADAILWATDFREPNQSPKAWLRATSTQRLVLTVENLATYADKPSLVYDRLGLLLAPELALAYSHWLAGSAFALGVRYVLDAAGLKPDVGFLRGFNLKPRYYARHLPEADWLADELPLISPPEPPTIPVSESGTAQSRKPIQIMSSSSICLTALCDDGTIWGYDPNERTWHALPAVPQKPETKP